MSTEFASAGLTAGQLNAIVKKLGGHEGALKFLRGELSISEPQHTQKEVDGVIYFSVTSDGTTGEEWISRLESKGFRLGDLSKQVILSPEFKPTNGVTIEVAVLRGMLFEENDRVTKKILIEAEKRKLSKPNVELACLIRDKFTDNDLEDMGLWYIVTMHASVSHSGVGSVLLDAGRYEEGNWLYSSCGGKPNYSWSLGSGFAFIASKDLAQS